MRPLRPPTISTPLKQLESGEQLRGAPGGGAWSQSSETGVKVFMQRLPSEAWPVRGELCTVCVCVCASARVSPGRTGQLPVLVTLVINRPLAVGGW